MSSLWTRFSPVGLTLLRGSETAHSVARLAFRDVAHVQRLGPATLQLTLVHRSVPANNEVDQINTSASSWSPWLEPADSERPEQATLTIVPCPAEHLVELLGFRQDDMAIEVDSLREIMTGPSAADGTGTISPTTQQRAGKRFDTAVLLCQSLTATIRESQAVALETGVCADPLRERSFRVCAQV